MKILVVGDIHGSWGQLNTLINKKNPEIILQCGDFGWFPHLHDTKQKKKKWNQYGIKPQNTKIYWCPGNHENWDSLDEMSKKDDMIHEIMENVFYCEFGATLTLPDGQIVLFAGGADSIDKQWRTEGVDWWRQEIITEYDFYMLPDIDVDIIVSHTIPRKFIKEFPDEFPGTWLTDKLDLKFKDPSCKALDQVFDKYKPSQWFSGHFHRYMSGTYKDCKWEGLSAPGFGDKWWTVL